MDIVYRVSIWLLPLLFAITFHEAAHGYVARFLGDETASRLGRVSLNPLRHIDPFGTVLGVIFLIAAAMYFLVPADSLPTFFPGHETGLMRIRAKHGMLSGALGVVLLAGSWFLSRK